MAKGSYFVFLDADDLISSNYVSECVGILEKNPNCQLVYTMARYFGLVNQFWQIPLYEGFRSLLLCNRFPITAMHRAARFHQINGFDETFHTHEDWEYWIRLLNLGGEVFQIPKILFQYRKRFEQLSFMDKLQRDNNLIREDFQKIYQKHTKLFMENNLSYYELSAIVREDSKWSLCGGVQALVGQSEKTATIRTRAVATYMGMFFGFEEVGENSRKFF